MSRAMKEARSVVDRKGIAPLRRVANCRPKSYLDDVWVRWQARRAEVEKNAVADLEAAGARIRWTAQITVIDFGGLRAQSTQGLLMALLNWRTRSFAEKSGS